MSDVAEDDVRRDRCANTSHRSTRRACLAVLCCWLALPLAVADAAGNAGTTLTPDLLALMANKDIGNERWTINLNLAEPASGSILSATGNVFRGVSDSPAFVYCELRSDSTGSLLDPASIFRFSCRGAPPCRDTPEECATNDWSLISDDVEVRADFFLPDAGLVETTGRNFVNQETKANYLLGDQFVNGAGKIIAEDPSPASIWRKTGIPVTDIHGRPVLSDLADTRSVDDVRAIIDRTTQLTGPLDTPGFTYKLKQAIDSRLFASMPYGSIADASDKNVNIKILDDIMRAGNVPQITRDAALDAYIRDPSPIAGLKAVSDTVTEHLVNRYGVPEAKARALANFWPNAKNHLSAYDIDQSTGVERIKRAAAQFAR
jgi:hypothetical protein